MKASGRWCQAACRFALLAALLSACGEPSAGAISTPSPTPSASNPSPTIAPGFGPIAYDAARQRVVLFGGSSATGHTWTWDGTTWVRLQPGSEPPIESPKPMAASAWPMAYDEVHRTVVLLVTHPARADGPPTPPPDTWTWDGNTWTMQPISLPASADGSMVYSAASNRVLLVGSVTSNHQTTPHMWSWTGTTWEALDVTQLPRSFGPTAYDEARGQVVMVIPSAAETPPAHGTDTWTWDGLRWTQRHPATSPPASTGGGAALAFDADRRTVVMFGGLYKASRALDQTWTWDGATWTMRRPATVPPARFNHAMAYDAATHTVVLTGGAGSSPDGSFPGLTDTWTWDGATWTRR